MTVSTQQTGAGAAAPLAHQRRPKGVTKTWIPGEVEIVVRREVDARGWVHLAGQAADLQRAEDAGLDMPKVKEALHGCLKTCLEGAENVLTKTEASMCELLHRDPNYDTQDFVRDQLREVLDKKEVYDTVGVGSSVYRIGGLLDLTEDAQARSAFEHYAQSCSEVCWKLVLGKQEDLIKKSANWFK